MGASKTRTPVTVIRDEMSAHGDGVGFALTPSDVWTARRSGIDTKWLRLMPWPERIPPMLEPPSDLDNPIRGCPWHVPPK